MVLFYGWVSAHDMQFLGVRELRGDAFRAIHRLFAQVSQFGRSPPVVLLGVNH